MGHWGVMMLDWTFRVHVSALSSPRFSQRFFWCSPLSRGQALVASRAEALAKAGQSFWFYPL